MKYLQLDYEEIKNKYPKSLKGIISWFATREDIVEFIKRENKDSNVEEIVGGMVPMIIQHDPRKLYEFFDSKNVIITLSYANDSSGDHFFCAINGVEWPDKSDRIDAEKAAFLAAFKYLEDNLLQ